MQTRLGRPRSERAREATLTAVNELLRESPETLTMEGVARRAGVGKPTLYRWWPSLADIVLESLRRQAEADIPLPDFDTLEKALSRFLRDSVQALDWCGIHLRFLMAQAQRDDEFRERFRDHFVARRRAVLRTLFEQAAERGQLAPTANLDLLTDMIFGPMWYRLLTGHGPLDAAFADELTAAVVRLAR